MRATLVFVLAVVVGALGITGCSYDPHIKDGELRCSLAGACPNGYSCRNNACYSSGRDAAGLADGAGTGGNAGTGTDAGAGADGPSAALVNRYVGNWTLDSTSRVLTTCDDNLVRPPVDLSPTDMPSVMKITASTTGQADLQSAWLCTLGLRLDQLTGQAHLFDANPTCQDTTQDPVETWTATKFDLIASTAKAATHTAAYTLVDKYADGHVVTCSQAVTASMTKN